MFSCNICLFKHHFIIIFHYYNIDIYDFSLFFIIYVSLSFLGGCVPATYVFVLGLFPRPDIHHVCISALYMCVFIFMYIYFLFYSLLYIRYVFVFVEINLSLSLYLEFICQNIITLLIIFFCRNINSLAAVNLLECDWGFGSANLLKTSQRFWIVRSRITRNCDEMFPLVLVPVSKTKCLLFDMT